MSDDDVFGNFDRATDESLLIDDLSRWFLELCSARFVNLSADLDSASIKRVRCCANAR